MKHIHEFVAPVPNQIISFAKLWFCIYRNAFPLYFNKKTGELSYNLNPSRRNTFTSEVFAEWFAIHDINDPKHDHSTYILNIE